jgi:putative ABC transport system permease protein
MIANYLIVALRNLARNRPISFINIGGLAVGFACAIFIALFVRDELSYDRWIPGTDNLYRVEITFNNPGQPPEPTSMAPFPMPQAMLQKIPEVRAMTRLMPESMTAIVGNREFSETVDVVDPNFLQLIKLPLLHGSPDHAFAQPESAVLSQSVSRRYFGSQNPMGRTVTFSGLSCDAGFAAKHPADGGYTDPQHIRHIPDVSIQKGKLDMDSGLGLCRLDPGR